MSTFRAELRKFAGEIRANLKRSDWYYGMSDFLLSFGLIAVFVGLLLEAPFADFLHTYFELWYVWELLSIVTLPSLIWIFEKRGPEDPRAVDVPRPLRVGICLFFLFLWGMANLKAFFNICYHAAPFVLAKGAPFLFDQPIYRDFIKACRRLGFAFLYFIVFGIIFAFSTAAIGVEAIQFEKGHGGLVFGALYFLCFGFIETFAWPVRRVFDLDQVDREHA